MNIQLATIFAFLLVGSVGSPALADDQVGALKLIRETAADICNTIPLDSSSRVVELTGDAKAKLSGTLAKIADLGIEGAAKYKTDQSKGVLQKELAVAIKSNADCKLEVLKLLNEKLLRVGSSTTIEYSTTCKFTMGPRAGTTFHFQPGTVIPAPVGAPCQDAVGSYGFAIKD